MEHKYDSTEGGMTQRDAKRATGSEETRHLTILLVATFVVGLGALAVGVSLHWIAGTRFAPWSNYISELAVGPPGSDIAFLVLIIGLALLTGTFFVAAPPVFARSLGDRVPEARVARAFGVAGALLLVVMAFFPLDASRPLIFTVHQIIAVAVFVCVSGQLAAYGRLLSRWKPAFRVSGVLAYLASGLALLFAVIATFTELVELIPRSPATHLIQWSAFLFFGTWMLVTGIALERDRAGH